MKAKGYDTLGCSVFSDYFIDIEFLHTLLLYYYDVKLFILTHQSRLMEALNTFLALISKTEGRDKVRIILTIVFETYPVCYCSFTSPLVKRISFQCLQTDEDD